MNKRSHQFFENWARLMGMTYFEKQDIGDAEILLADSSRPIDYQDRANGIISRQYVTGYCIRREGGNWLASWQPYDPLDYFGDSEKVGRRKRLEDALKFARERAGLTDKAGLYDGYRLQLN